MLTSGLQIVQRIMSPESSADYKKEMRGKGISKSVVNEVLLKLH